MVVQNPVKVRAEALKPELVGVALQNLAEALRLERIAQKTYQGDAWEVDGRDYILKSQDRRQEFERALDEFVEFLSKA